MQWTMLYTCDGCEMTEERIFTDSWTGKQLCCGCLYKFVGQITMGPSSEEGDNLPQLIEDYA